MEASESGLLRFRSLAALVVGRLTQAVLALGLLKLMTNRLSKTEVAHFYFIVATTTWFLLLLVNPVGQWVNRHILEWRTKYSWGSIFSKHILFYGLITLIGVGFSIGANALFGLDESLSPIVLGVGVAGGVFLQSLYQQLCGLQNLLGPRVQYSVLIAIGQLIIFAAASCVFLISDPTVLHWFCLIFIGHVLALMLFQVFLRKQFAPGLPAARARDLLQWHGFLTFCLPIVAVTLAVWVQTQGYRIILSASGNLEVLALMSVGLGLASSIGGTLESLIQQYVMPGYYKSLTDKSVDHSDVWRKMFAKVMICLAVACLGLFCFGHIVLRILTSEAYLSGQRFVRWGAAIEFFRILGNFVYLNYIGEKRVMRAVPAYLFGAFVTIVFYGLSFVFSARAELSILLALLLGNFSNFALQLWIMRRETKWRPPVRPLIFSTCLCLPYALGFFVPADIGVVKLLFVLIVAGLYTLFVGWRLLPYLSARKITT